VAGTRLAVEELVEEQVVAPFGIRLKPLEVPVERAVAVVAPAEDRNRARRQLVGDVSQRRRSATGGGEGMGE
jgi:hypothetical protein